MTDTPYFATHISCCTNRRPDGHKRGSCAAAGSEGLRDYMKARAKELGLPNSRVNTAGCLDRCELGPVIVIYPEGVWYGVKNRDDVDEILHALKTRSGPVERLKLPPGAPPAAIQAGDPAGESSPDPL